LGSSFIIETY